MRGRTARYGYRIENGKPEIVESEAETVRRIYAQYLQGDSLKGIARQLTEDGIRTPRGKPHWEPGTVRSILSNERYKGDAILGKTYIEDCISKKIRVNAGERPKYYVQHGAGKYPTRQTERKTDRYSPRPPQPPPAV